MTPTGRVVLASLATGVLGWALENVLFGERYSYHLPGVPFLPVYAAGGAAIALLEPHVSPLPLAEQVLAYGATLTAIEGTAGALERAEGRRSWDYGGSPVDVPHALAWAVLGTAVGQTLQRLT